MIDGVLVEELRSRVALGLDQTQVEALMQAAFYGSVSTDAYREATGVSRTRRSAICASWRARG